MILFFYGPDSYCLREKINELKKEHQEIAEVLTWEDFKLVDKNVSLFALRKLILIPALKEEFLPLEFSENIVVFYEVAPDKRTKIFKKLLRVAECREFFPLKNKELFQWIIKRAKVNPGAVKALATRAGGDLWKLDNELKKLSGFTNYTKAISVDDVNLLFPSETATDIFRTIASLARGDKKNALRYLTEHLARGDEELYLFSMIIYQFRMLIKIKTNETEGLHPFALQKSRALAESFTLERLKFIYQKLLWLDLKTKQGVFSRPATFFGLLYSFL